MTQHTVHVGRQPVFDIEHHVLGYELLFRTGPTAETADFHEAQADFVTAETIVNTFTQFGIRSLVGPGLAFVNVTRPFLTGELPLPLDPDRAVLEVLADTYPDPHVIEGCRHLVERGYRLALDDLRPGDPRLALLALASYVKLDFSGRDAEELADVAAVCRDTGVELVAKKVETRADMEAAWVLGCTMFQGRHLAHAQVLETPTLTPDRLQCLHLLGALAQPDVSFEDIEEMVRLEPALAVRLLTVANSAATGARRQITSVHDALVLLGLSQLRSWVQLMVFADLAGESTEVFSAALIRARTCELLAAGRAGLSGDAAFTAGLVSSLDALLGQPIEWIAARMGLGQEMHFALTAGDGPLGELLEAVRRYEEGADPDGDGPYHSAELSQAYLTGMQWSRRREPAAFAHRSPRQPRPHGHHRCGHHATTR